MKRIAPLFFILIVSLALSACSLPQAPTATQPASQRPEATRTSEPPATATPTLPPQPTPTWAPGCPPPNLVSKTVPENFSMADLPGAAYFDSPAGIEFESGWLIGFDNMDDETVFALEIVSFKRLRYVLLERIVCNEPGGKAYYLVLDVMSYPTLEANEGFGSEIVCTLDGVRDENILAVAEIPEELFEQPFSDFGYQLGPVRRAWRANTETGKFELSSTQGIQCYMQWMGD